MKFNTSTKNFSIKQKSGLRLDVYGFLGTTFTESVIFVLKSFIDEFKRFLFKKQSIIDNFKFEYINKMKQDFTHQVTFLSSK